MYQRRKQTNESKVMIIVRVLQKASRQRGKGRETKIIKTKQTFLGIYPFSTKVQSNDYDKIVIESKPLEGRQETETIKTNQKFLGIYPCSIPFYFSTLSWTLSGYPATMYQRREPMIEYKVMIILGVQQKASRQRGKGRETKIIKTNQKFLGIYPCSNSFFSFNKLSWTQLFCYKVSTQKSADCVRSEDYGKKEVENKPSDWVEQGDRI